MLLTHGSTVLIRNSIFRVVHLGSLWTGGRQNVPTSKNTLNLKFENWSSNALGLYEKAILTKRFFFLAYSGFPLSLKKKKTNISIDLFCFQLICSLPN